MKNVELNLCIEEAMSTIDVHYRFLNLGFFLNFLAKTVNFSRVFNGVQILTETNEIYFLKIDLIRNMLEAIYQKPKEDTILSTLTLIHSVRGITMAIDEALKNTDFKASMYNDIFNKDESKFSQFEGIVKFIRNVLSHNIMDKLELTGEEYSKQKDWWLKCKQTNEMRFTHDYTLPNSFLVLPAYKTQVSITVKWSDVVPGVSFGKIVNTFQCLMLCEFCYNATSYLHNNYH